MPSDPIAFIHGLAASDIPESARHEARRCLLDTAGVAVAGLATPCSRILRDHAADHHGAGRLGGRMIFDGRRVSVPGAALAGAGTIDSFDAHDGHRLTKGHMGVTILPALLAFADEVARCKSSELLTRFVLGYEIATRAAIALHGTVADYHTSGAWNALGAAALGARALGLDRDGTRHALGIAEYFGPRSQMMRVIDHPSMLKDGSAMGAFAGVGAALLAGDGFTGAPAITVEAPEVADVWRDLGVRWTMEEQYLKPYPVCRWAQPAMEAVMALRARAPAEEIARVKVITFHEAVRLAARAPANTEEAQYSLPFPVAVALVHGKLGAEQVSGPGLDDPAVLRLSAAVELEEDTDYSARFPGERWARVELVMADGRRLSSGPTTTRGDPETRLSDAEVAGKFEMLASGPLGPARCRRLSDAILDLGSDRPVDSLIDDLLSGAEATQEMPRAATVSASS